MRIELVKHLERIKHQTMEIRTLAPVQYRSTLLSNRFNILEVFWGG